MHREEAVIAVSFEFINQHDFISLETVGAHPDNKLTHM